MSDEFAEKRELRARFMRAAYRHRQAPLGIASMDDIMRELGLDPHPKDNYDVHIRNLYYDLASYWEDRGFIEGFADGHRLIKVTTRGIQYVEGDLNQPQAPSTITFNVENAPQSIFGTQHHAEINISLDFKSIEATLDRAEREIDERGGPDADMLRDLIAELRAIHQSDEPVRKGQLAKYMEVIQRNGWVASPIANTLLAQITGTA